ncbi:MAG: class I SAM-dependent methyltransferase [Bacteroidota bacterium]
MKLNVLGRASMNSSARRVAQTYVAALWERLGGQVQNGRVLEVGCGGGVGVIIIVQRFGAAEVHAFDLDPRMIDRARRRLASYSFVHLSVGDVTAIDAENASFDAVFDFGAIHLEPNWQKAVTEVRRVLKPGGRFFFELVTNRFLRASYPLVTEGFRNMNPPGANQFIDELERQGIAVGKNFVLPKLAPLTGFVGDLIGVGHVQPGAMTEAPE